MLLCVRVDEWHVGTVGLVCMVGLDRESIYEKFRRTGGRWWWQKLSLKESRHAGFSPTSSTKLQDGGARGVR